MSKCILAVDDDRLVISLVKHTLQDKGYEVMTAQDGQEAWETLNKRIPDLILLDVMMPKVDGYSFILKKSKSNNPAIVNIPIIVLTSMGQTERIFKRHGVKAYLMKPIDTLDLLNKIQAIVSA